MLTLAEVTGYLLGRGLLSAESVVHGDLAIRDASSRNRNFKVECSAGPSYLLKQGLGAEGSAMTAHEAHVYRLLSAGSGRLARYLPHFFDYDVEQGILVIELVSAGEDLRRYHLRHGRIPPPLAAAAGRALGSLHRMTRRQPEGVAYPEQAPWILTIHKPDIAIFREASSASLELIKTVQAAGGLGQRLDELRARWKVEALIHYDVKWDNFIALEAAGPGKPARLKLVDWESAMYGDPCWDIGSVFSHFLSLWLFSIPVTGQVPPERFPELARFPLGKMQPAIRRCWDAYVAEMGLSFEDSGRWLMRSVELGAARLIQTAFEAAQMSTNLTSNLVLHLQLGLNMLQRPREAIVHLLGLPLPGVSAAS